MDDALLVEAEKFAAMIAADPRFKKLREVENDVLSKPELKRLMEDYEACRLTIARKERDLDPIEPDEKRALAEFGRRVQDAAPLRDLAKAQADYSAMMELVNRTIQGRLKQGFTDAG